ncbi:MAG: hypothetical protein M9962_06795 [Oligoflexia bacterium]|nr:hypothetical protein [Oligoflexia bacterium]
MIEFKIIATSDRSQQATYIHPGASLTFGSQDAEMVIDDPDLASVQFRVFAQGGQSFVENLVPEIELRVNGRAIDGPSPLKAKDNLSVARTTINFSKINELPPSPPPPFEHPQAEHRFAPETKESAILDVLDFLAKEHSGGSVKKPPPPLPSASTPPPLPGAAKNMPPVPPPMKKG